MSVSASEAAGTAGPASADTRSRIGPGLVDRRDVSILLVGFLTAIGVALRLAVAQQSLFADELSTYWIVTAHGLGGVVSTVHSNAEITPPLYFVASWLTSKLGHAPVLVRLPSLVAGTLIIPATYLLGLRTVGRAAALLATGLTALAPFMIYYSAEARGYAVMMLMVVLSTLAMLVAVDTRRARWWGFYALFSCAAVYTHYTSVFALAAQLLWVLWAHPSARKPAFVANLGAIVLFLPWTSGLINDFTSPTSRILSALSPFTPNDVRIALEHWSIGYPYASLPLHRLPGVAALGLLALAIVVGLGALGLNVLRARSRLRLAVVDRQLVLVVALFLSAPIGEAIASAVSTNLFGVRNLAPSWPGFALLLAALLTAAGPRLRIIAAVLAIAGFAIGAARIVETRFERPRYQAAADLVDHLAAPGDVVIDETGVLSPGPLTPLDVTLARGHRVLRAGAPAERDHPFGFFDPIEQLRNVVPKAVAAADGRRIFLVANTFPRSTVGEQRSRSLHATRFPAGYRMVEARNFPGLFDVVVRIYEPAG